jgi:hypothetical protein
MMKPLLASTRAAHRQKEKTPHGREAKTRAKEFIRVLKNVPREPWPDGTNQAMPTPNDVLC